MDKGWYVRFLFVFSLTVAAWFALWPTLDGWLPAPGYVKDIFSSRISPGLDIRGGLRLVYEVEVDEAIRDRRDTRAEQILNELGIKLGIIPEAESPTRDHMAKTRARVDVAKLEDRRRFRVSFKSASDTGQLDRELLNRYEDLREISRSDTEVVLAVDPDFLANIRDTAVQQARETISNRVDGLGLKETSITAQGTDIIVEVPGADESAFERIREIISKTARLEFKIVADESTFVADLADLPEGVERRVEPASAGPNKPQVASSYLVAYGEDAYAKLESYVETLASARKIPADQELLLGEIDPLETNTAGAGEAVRTGWRTYTLYSRTELTGDYIQEAFVSSDERTNKPNVLVNFEGEGIDALDEMSGRNVKRRMAIVLDDQVKSAPVIQERIGGGHCQITLGGYRDYTELLNEARDLVLVLKAGALPVPIRPSNEQLIGPTLGQDAVQKGARGVLVGVSMVLVFMLIYYQAAGAVADLMVLLNLLFLLATLAIFVATLTLPGIAGIALTVGMAVDANVLVTERIREELRTGKSTRAAVEQGFGRAFWAIMDSQFTTFLAGVVLFNFGTGPIKGFAVTLMAGICSSLFTGVFCSRVMFDWIARGLRIQRLPVG